MIEIFKYLYELSKTISEDITKKDKNKIIFLSFILSIILTFILFLSYVLIVSFDVFILV